MVKLNKAKVLLNRNKKIMKYMERRRLHKNLGKILSGNVYGSKLIVNDEEIKKGR